MRSFRDSVLTLPFVGKNADGTLNYWDVTPTGNHEIDFELGRAYAARSLHFCRAFNAPILGVWISEASLMRPQPWDDVFIKEGWVSEMVDAVRHAPLNATPNYQMVQSVMTQCGARDIEQLPFVSRRPDGSLNYWAVEPSGDWSRDTATGRYYGALLAQAARLTQAFEIFGDVMVAMLLSGRFEETRAIWTGLHTETTTILMQATPNATLHQKAQWPYHQAAVAA